MRTGIIRATVVFIAVGLLVLALISPVTRQSPPADTTTPVVPTQDAEYEPVSSNLSADLFPATPRAPADPLVPPWNELPADPRGAQVIINGEPATICIHGDGWGTNIWAGNANTSCEFVTATQQALTAGLNPTQDNLRNHLTPQITVTSPVTGNLYDLTCSHRSALLMACAGGNNAVVYFY